MHAIHGKRRTRLMIEWQGAAKNRPSSFNDPARAARYILDLACVNRPALSPHPFCHRSFLMAQYRCQPQDPRQVSKAPKKHIALPNFSSPEVTAFAPPDQNQRLTY